MRFEKYLKEKIKQYDGEDVDCFGLTFSPNLEFELKCYKYVVERRDDKIINTFVSNNKNITRCDYKIEYNIRNDYNKICEFINNTIKYNGELNILFDLWKLSNKYNNDFRIMEIGTRLDTVHNNCALRGYFSLRCFENDRDVKGKFSNYKNKKYILHELASLLNLQKKYLEFIEIKSKSLEKNGYYLSMFGVQKFTEKIEEKIYFELAEPDNHFNTILNANIQMIKELIPWRSIDMYEKMKQSILVFWGYGYFVRGIAFGILNNEQYSIRLYFSKVESFI